MDAIVLGTLGKLEDYEDFEEYQKDMESFNFADVFGK
jgi:hypothetical protein